MWERTRRSRKSRSPTWLSHCASGLSRLLPATGRLAPPEEPDVCLVELIEVPSDKITRHRPDVSGWTYGTAILDGPFGVPVKSNAEMPGPPGAQSAVKVARLSSNTTSAVIVEPLNAPLGIGSVTILKPTGAVFTVIVSMKVLLTPTVAGLPALFRP